RYSSEYPCFRSATEGFPDWTRTNGPQAALKSGDRNGSFRRSAACDMRNLTVGGSRVGPPRDQPGVVVLRPESRHAARRTHGQRHMAARADGRNKIRKLKSET